jgi:hypothetical protein
LLHEVQDGDRWISLEELLLSIQPEQRIQEPVPEGEAPLTQSISTPPSGPPPLPPEELFYIAKSGRQEGPYNRASLKQLVAGGLVSHDDLAWKEGLPEWTAIGRLMPDLPRPTAISIPPIGGTPPSTPPPDQRLVSSVPPTTSNGLGGEVIGGYVCSLIALLFFPFVFALAAFICGIVALTKGRVGHGIAILVLSCVCCFIGMVIGAAVTSS